MIKYTLVMIVSTILFSMPAKGQTADLIIKNAKIYTVDPEFSKAEALAVKDGLFVGVGTNEEILNQFTGNNIIDANGKTIYPGFIDAHCHFLMYGQTLQKANLRDTKSFDEILDILKKHYQQNPEGWLEGTGWDHNDWPVKEFPDNKKLNKLFPTVPVILTRIDGHAVLANEEAIIASGINPDNFAEDEVIRENGKMTGIFLENAADALKKAIPPVSRKRKEEALLKAQRNCFAVGLSSIHDAGLPHGDIALIDSLQEKGDLKMRIYSMMSPDKENMQQLANGPVVKPRLHVASIKLYADGALGSRGAKLLEPYSDAPETSGIFVNEKEYLENICQKAYEAGFQINTHCIGDAAVKRILDIYQEILGGPNDRRWRIEHVQIVAPEDFARFRELNVIPSVQTTHCTSDMYWAAERIGVRIKYAYAYKQLLDENGWLANGSDFPIEEINPILGFYAGVVRKDPAGWPPERFQPENAISRKEALQAMTIWAAKAAFEEKEKGSIESGKLADFVMLDTDLMEAKEDQLVGSKVLLTVSNGEIVYRKD
ncbi:amidohydrolase [Prolixibacter bellariivorans]|uniref:Amidohydrolase n=1 Tax=Prolixibacter bellariivorans TaxID=314319 RepID=A0A5M4AZ50_9BACT|nr:amidohydrolase [Prolixibacter bellariivorans]GET32896.1 amidohydrolase [Prolixibacter bellariivorans]